MSLNLFGKENDAALSYCQIWCMGKDHAMLLLD